MDKWISISTVAIAFGMTFSVALAEEEYDAAAYARRSLADRAAIHAVGNDVMGDEVDPVTYNVSFTNSEISLAGNGPPMVITRTFDVAERMLVDWRHLEAFADWRLEVPRIETTTLSDSSLRDRHMHVKLDLNKTWTVAGTPVTVSSQARCSKFGLPPGSTAESTNWLNSLWWPGVTLKVPGAGAQKVLVRSVQNSVQPAATGFLGVSSNYPLVTSGNWQIACIDSLKNAVNGEGFFAIDPNGTKYWFDWMTAYNPHTAQRYWDAGNGEGFNLYIFAADTALVATRVEDRFGNYVTYTYSGNKLTDIHGSDGRHIRIDWLPPMTLQLGNASKTSTAEYIGSITVQPQSSNPQVFNYEYAQLTDTFTSKYQHFGVVLKRIILPDGSTWEFSLGNLSNSCAEKTTTNPWSEYSCMYYVREYNTLQFSGSIKAPSGAQGEFTFIPSKYTRNWDYPGREDDPNVISYLNDDPYEMDYPHIIQKRITGPGVDSTWKYAYWKPSSNYLYGPISVGPGGSFRVENPDGSVTVKNVNNLWRHRHEGRLLNESVYKNKTFSELVSTTKYVYSDSNTGPYPESLGDSKSSLIIARQWSVLWPKISTQITQDGRVFKSEVASDCSGMPYCFDNNARPTKIVRASSPAP